MGQENPDKIMLTPFTINSSTGVPTFETAIELKDDNWQECAPFAHSSNGNIYVGMNRPGDDSAGQGDAEPAIATSYAASSSVTTENFLGWASAAASDGATAKIKVTGNTVTGLSSLTPGKKYYVQSDGSVGLTPINGKTVEAGVALTSSSLLIR